VPVDCAALAASLVEAELFGHERGAFTGANVRREGLVSAARDGTFFLDEVGELSVAAQTRLLRLLEGGTYRPVGAQTERQARIRVVAATWRDLQQGVRDGSFREDLYHRLTAVELVLPALRERPDDIEVLLEHFLEQAARRQDRRAPNLGPAARAHLMRWPWPGNVRELRNVARYLVAMTTGPRAGMEDLPTSIRRAPRAEKEMAAAETIRIDLPYMEARRHHLDQFQLRYVSAILDAHNGNVSAAARAAGMDRRSIQRILARAKEVGTQES
jgi:DNA-binding NtrC family response regulator